MGDLLSPNLDLAPRGIKLFTAQIAGRAPEDKGAAGSALLFPTPGQWSGPVANGD